MTIQNTKCSNNEKCPAYIELDNITGCACISDNGDCMQLIGCNDCKNQYSCLLDTLQNNTSNLTKNLKEGVFNNDEKVIVLNSFGIKRIFDYILTNETKIKSFNIIYLDKLYTAVIIEKK